MHFRLCYLIGLFSLIHNAYQATYVCDPDAQCGCSQFPVTANARIVNGEDAGLHTWSWTVSLNISGGLCGGTIIDPYFVLTAAHCLYFGIQPSNITISAAALVYNEGTKRAVSRIYSHPEYNALLETNDIALLRVDVPFDLSSVELAKICLPNVVPSSDEYPAPNTSLMVVGWGDRSFGANSGWRMLQQVTVKAVGSQTTYCKKLINDPKLQFCAGIMPEGGKGERSFFFLLSVLVDQNVWNDSE